MKLKSISHVFRAILTTVICALLTSTAFAKHKMHKVYKDEGALPIVVITPAFVPTWYVEGNIGVSRVHDKKAAGSTTNSVTQTGPGWSADAGYQFYNYRNFLFAGELGYTNYHDSTENTGTTNVATTEHFSSHLAARVTYPLGYNFSVLGKLGVAYSYAKKIFTATGASASANVYSPHYGLGLSYNVSQRAAFVGQWARARGNGKTGSTDLYSLGVLIALS